MDRIAVLMINYNGYEDTINSLESIAALSLGDRVKIFCIDNSSSNDSVAQLESWLEGNRILDVELIQSDTNRGFSGGNNLGLARALEEGFPYIMLLNNDTIVNEDIFTASMDYLARHNECHVLALHTIAPDGTREKYNTRRKPGFFNLLFLYHSPFWNAPWFPGYKKHFMLDKDSSETFEVYAGNGSCLAFKREYFDATGTFDDATFLFTEEFIIAERALWHGMNTCFMPEPRVIHLGGATTKKSSAFSYVAYCRSEVYLAREYYRWGRVKMMILFAMRLLKFCVKMVSSGEYRRHFSSFLKVYFNNG